MVCLFYQATTIYYLKSSQGFFTLDTDAKKKQVSLHKPKENQNLSLSLFLSLSLSLTHTHTHTHTQIPVLKEDHGSVGQDFPNHKSSTTSLVVSFLYQIGLLLFLMKLSPPDPLLSNTSYCLSQANSTNLLPPCMYLCLVFYNTL